MNNRRLLLIVAMLCISQGCGGSGSPVAGMSVPSGGTLTFQEGDQVATSFGENFYVPVECTVEPGMLEMGLPVDPAEVINLTELMSRTGLGETPESLLRNGFVVYRPFYTTDNLDRSTENGQSL